MSESVSQIAERLRPYWSAQYLSVADTSFSIAVGRFTLEGDLTDRFRLQADQSQQTQLMVKVSKVAHITSRSQYVIPRHCIALWLRHLVAQVVADGQQVESILIGEGASVRLAPISASDAQARLDELGALFDDALVRPLATALPLAWSFLDKPERFDLAQAYMKEEASLAYLARFYRSAEALLAAEFENVSTRHYQSFKTAMAEAQLQPLGQGGQS